MKRKWSLHERFKGILLVNIVILPFVILFFLILGIVFCIKFPAILWVGLLLLVFSMVFVAVAIYTIKAYTKEIDYEEDEEVEKGKALYLVLEAQRMKEEQENSRLGLVDYNDKIDKI